MTIVAMYGWGVESTVPATRTATRKGVVWETVVVEPSGERIHTKGAAESVTYGNEWYDPFDSLRQVYHSLGAKLVLVDNLRQAHQVQFNALLLRGGGDINPFWYGEENVHSRGIDNARDKVEWVLIQRARNEGCPILGICRGMQFLNVAFGGSLFQDIRTYGVSSDNHQMPGTHRLEWCSGWNLPATVNSRHHQTVNRLGTGLHSVAFSSDGLIEAVYGPGVFGIQGHPEDLVTKKNRWRNLFASHLAGFQS